MTLVEPIRRTLRVSTARRSLDWTSSGSSPISSRNSVPPWAASNTPMVARPAPVNAPCSWPKIVRSAPVRPIMMLGCASSMTLPASARAGRLVEQHQARVHHHHAQRGGAAVGPLELLDERHGARAGGEAELLQGGEAVGDLLVAGCHGW